MPPRHRPARVLAGIAAATLWWGVLPDPAQAQCASRPETSLFGGQGFDGDEPDDFTHYVDTDGDGRCDFSGDTNGNGTCDDPGCAATVAWDAAAGVHPNGVYPDCRLALYEEGTPYADFILQRGHSHWEYTHLQTDPNGAPEQKEYFSVIQAMQTDFANGDTGGTATLASIQAMFDFLAGEPARFEAFLLTNPSGRYWQVDEWIGPPLPGLTWQERFFACGDSSGTHDCALVNGETAFGGYWSDHAEQAGYAGECGDGLLDDPEPELDDPADPDGRVEACGILFVECEDE